MNQGHLAATELDENWTGWGPSEQSTQQAEPVLADVERDAPLCKTLLGLAVHDHRGRAEASKRFPWAHKLSNAIAARLCPPFPLGFPHFKPISHLPRLRAFASLVPFVWVLARYYLSVIAQLSFGKQGCLVVSTFISFYFAHGTRHYLMLERLLLLLPDTTKNYLRGTTKGWCGCLSPWLLAPSLGRVQR